MNPGTKTLFEKIHAVIEAHEPKDDSLLGGSLGLCLYYYTLYKIFDKEEYAEKALDLVEQAANLPDEESKTLFGATFSTGGAGLCYMIKTLHNEGLVEMDLTDDLEELDEYIYRSGMDMIQKEGNTDFLHGAAGIIHYFTHRLPDMVLQEKLTNLVAAFLDKKITTEGGTWFSGFVMDTDDRSEINFSLSHGQTGYLLTLMNAYKKGIELPQLPSVIESGVELALKFLKGPEPGSDLCSIFPSMVKNMGTGEQIISNRLAWCYGDLDILLLLYEASAFLNKPEWRSLADELGKITVKRTSEKETAVSDSHFCHGTAGLCTMYQRLFALSGMKEYNDAANYWLQQTLSLIPAELENNVYATKEASLLEGLVGVNLVLASSLAGQSDWSRALLV